MCRGSAARVLYEAETLEQQTMHLHKCDHVFFFYGGGGGGGGVVRLTAKPRYLLLLHRGNKKSNTVTALVWTCAGSGLSTRVDESWAGMGEERGLGTVVRQFCCQNSLQRVIALSSHLTSGEWRVKPACPRIISTVGPSSTRKVMVSSCRHPHTVSKGEQCILLTHAPTDFPEWFRLWAPRHGVFGAGEDGLGGLGI